MKNALLLAPNIEERDHFSYVLRHMGLQSANHAEAERALQLLLERAFDLLVICTKTAEMLPIINEARERTHVPILLIADSLTEDEHCAYLDHGVDCVLQRPISMRLFDRYARMLLKRSGSIPAAVLSTITADGLALNPNERTVTVDDNAPLHLTQLEFRLIYVLMTHAEQVIPTEELVERVWGYGGTGDRDLVRGLVRRLRKKIDPEAKSPRFIHNLPGVGYRFSVSR